MHPYKLMCRHRLSPEAGRRRTQPVKYPDPYSKSFTSLCSYIFLVLVYRHTYTGLPAPQIHNKRAQRALGRSPEEKVKGHSGANNRDPQGHNLNNFGKGPFDNAIY